jgi:hypothetical protein
MYVDIRRKELSARTPLARSVQLAESLAREHAYMN